MQPATDEELLMSGISLLAGRLLVGQARIGPGSSFGLFMGAAEIWEKHKGWMGQARSKFPTKNIMTAMMLDGLAANFDEFE